MAAATMMDSDNQVFFDARDELLFNVTTILPNLMKFGQK